MKIIKKLLPLICLFLGMHLPVVAAPLFGTELSGFAVLGASTVTSTGLTALVGDLGVSPGTAITGFGPGTYTGTFYPGGPVAATAHAQLGAAMANLAKLGSGTALAGNLNGLTLAPGVYTVAPLASNLSQVLTLDGGGNPNAYWVFLMPSTLITSPGAVVNVINTGAGAGIYWVVGSSATINANTIFAGNILASASITLGSGAAIGCGRAMAYAGAVTMINVLVNATTCAGTSGVGSNGFNGGLVVPDDGGPPVPVQDGGNCLLTAAETALLLSIPDHVSETSQSVSITTVRKSDNSAGCTPALAGLVARLRFVCSYLNPSSGSQPVRLEGNVALSANLGSACSASGIEIAVTLDAAGIGHTTLLYADAGHIRLDASYSVSGVVVAGSGSFVAAPAGFVFSQLQGTAAPNLNNPAASSADGPVFLKAGKAFSASLTAINRIGNLTPNFGQENSPETVLLAPNLILPVGGALPPLSGNVDGFSAGVARATNLTWPEAGIITLTASLANARGYLGGQGATANQAVTGISERIGRFIPDHFDTFISAGVPMSCPAGLSCPAAGFVYAGQPFGMTVVARSLTGSTTLNYQQALARSVTLTAWDAPGSTVLQNPPAAPRAGSLRETSLVANNFSLGSAAVADQAYGLAAAFTAANPSTASLSAPVAIHIRALDSDGISSALSASVVEGGVTVASGRLLIVNNFGSELLALPVKVVAQFWDGRHFAGSSTDNSSSFGRSDIQLENCTGNLRNGTGCKTAFAPAATPVWFALTGGVARLTLTAAGAGNTGSADLRIAAMAWLPSTLARLRVGIYNMGPIIYLREMY
ncbi:MAG: MSHA biogenesis protein MshQ [Burkholderiaceae bacterium]|jgi:MSHA biogenesis protein MshQ